MWAFWLLIFTLSGAAAGAAPDKFALWTQGTRLRGANIYQRTVYPDVYDDPEVWGAGPLGPVLAQRDFDALSVAGANLVVLSHPGLLGVRPPYAPDQAARSNLDRLIAMAEKADLFVVIAFRTGPGRSEFGFFGVDKSDAFGMSHLDDGVWKSRAAQDAWVEMWRGAAARYRDNPVVVGYELMVEPNANGVWLDLWEPDDFYPRYANTLYDWNQLFPRITAAIRQVDRDTPILVGGMSWSAVRWLPYIRPTADPRTVYTAHQYEPQDQYTHQEADASGVLANRYPGWIPTWNGSRERFDRAWIDRLMTTVDTFSTRWHAPVAITEFGAVRWEPGAELFLDDEMSRFEASGVNWAIWSWQPASPAYTAAQNEFNFRLGSDPSDLAEGKSRVFDAVKAHWSKNTLRPSGFR